MKLLRRYLFYLMTLAYCVLCPVIILYAFGYFFSPKNQALIHTGLVYIATTPPKANIFLEKSRYAKITPAILDGLLPGDATLTLMLKAYRPWTHRITIEPGKALTFDKILLIPQRWPQREIFPDSIKDLIPLAGTNYLLIAKDRRPDDLYVYDLNDAKSWPLIPTGSPFGRGEILSFTTVAKDAHLLMRVALNGSEKILWLEIKKDKPSALRDISGFFSETPAAITWEPDEKNVLLDIHEDYVNHIDIAAKIAIPGIILDIRGFGLFNKKIFVLRANNTLEKLNINETSSKVLFENPELGENLFGKKGFFKITPLSDDIIVFLGPEGELLSNRLPYHFAEKGVLGFQFDARTGRLLVYQKNRIGILDFSVKPQNKTFELGPQLTWIYTKGKNIKQVWWVHEGSHILFCDNDEVFLMEPEPCGEPHVDYVTRVAPQIGLHYDEGSEQFYYGDPETKKPIALEIIPKHEI